MIRSCKNIVSRSCAFSTVAPSTSDFNKTIENGVVHVTSLNINTNERSIVQLEDGKSSRARRVRRDYNLPEAAVQGLRNVLIDCGRTPKQLQYEADTLNERLSQRRFPAPPSVVKAVRDKIKEDIRAEENKNNHHFGDDDLLGEKIKQAREQSIRTKTDKLLKKSHYNWRPLEFDDKESAARYALARLAPNYAEIARCLEEIIPSGFVPNTVLDYGSGCGSGFWAVSEMFGDAIKDYCMVDTSDQMTKVAMDIIRNEQSQMVSKNVSFRRHMPPSQQNTADLVILHRTLGEIGSEESRNQLVESLWKRANRFLIIIESGKSESFDALLNARDFILSSGIELQYQETVKLLKEHNLDSDLLIHTLRDKHLTEFERFSIVRENVPDNIFLPTALPTANVYAPCPHDLGCPLSGKSSCSFPIRWKPIRADGKRSTRETDGTETGHFSFVILEKGLRQPSANLGRLLKMRKMSGHVTCDVCTAFNGLQRLTVSKRAGELYKRTKAKRDGEVFPLSISTKATENMFDLYDQVCPPKL